MSLRNIYFLRQPRGRVFNYLDTACSYKLVRLVPVMYIEKPEHLNGPQDTQKGNSDLIRQTGSRHIALIVRLPLIEPKPNSRNFTGKHLAPGVHDPAQHYSFGTTRPE